MFFSSLLMWNSWRSVQNMVLLKRTNKLWRHLILKNHSVLSITILLLSYNNLDTVDAASSLAYFFLLNAFIDFLLADKWPELVVFPVTEEKGGFRCIGGAVGLSSGRSMGELQSALLLRKQLAGKNSLKHSDLELFVTYFQQLEFP